MVGLLSKLSWLDPIVMNFLTKLLCSHTGMANDYLNLGSYNYLGFAENQGPCSDAAIEAIREYGVSCCSTRRELGMVPVELRLEQTSGMHCGYSVVKRMKLSTARCWH